MSWSCSACDEVVNSSLKVKQLVREISSFCNDSVNPINPLITTYYVQCGLGSQRDVVVREIDEKNKKSCGDIIDFLKSKIKELDDERKKIFII